MEMGSERGMEMGSEGGTEMGSEGDYVSVGTLSPSQ